MERFNTWLESNKRQMPTWCFQKFLDWKYAIQDLKSHINKLEFYIKDFVKLIEDKKDIEEEEWDYQIERLIEEIRNYIKL